MVIPFLTNDIILGNDWNKRNAIVIDYFSTQIRIKYSVIPKHLVLFEQCLLDRLVCSKQNNETVIYVIKIDKLDLINTIVTCDKNLENGKMDIKMSKIELSNDEMLKMCDMNHNEMDLDKHLNENDIIDNQLNNDNGDIVLYLNEMNIESCTENENSLSRELWSIAYNNAGLNDSQKSEFYDLLTNKKQLFSNKLGYAKGYLHEIKLIKQNPSIKMNYSIPRMLKDKVRQTINDMINTGVIERAISPYCNPLRVVNKNDGDIRLCLDARKLNENIEDDCEAPPIISEILQDFDSVKIFSKLDLKHSFWQILLHPDSRPYTAFIFESIVYQWIRVPYGLKTAGSALIRALQLAIQYCSERLQKSLRKYVDDLLIGSSNFDEHLQVLSELFDKLIEYNFTINLKKCEFFQNTIIFLGCQISTKGVTPDPEKLSRIYNFEEPRNVTHLQSFLGVCNFYRRFCLMYSDFVDPFRDLLRKDAA